VAGYYSATQRHYAAAPLADFLTAAPINMVIIGSATWLASKLGGNRNESAGVPT
jgi:hypothetical protein